MTPAPIGAPALWTAVVDRDGGQCTCTGSCGRRHTAATPRPAGRRGRGPGANAVPDPVARCIAGLAGERLFVVPADPAAVVANAWKLPAPALTARCEPCVRATASRPRASRSGPADDPSAALAADAQLALLDLPDLPDVAGGPVRGRRPARPQRKAGPR